MTETPEALAPLERALEQTATVIAHASPDQASAPTPCRSFSLRQLINHVVHDVQLFAAMVTGADRGSQATDVVGDDWLAAYQAASRALLAAWREPGRLDGTLELPFGTVPATWSIGQQVADLAVHAWDIARATGQSVELDAELARGSLEWGSRNLAAQYRGDESSGKAFGPEVPVSQDAPIADRLAAFFGRDPRWPTASHR
jgi:uncharacterized protein (TIGR03086 family)